MGRQRHRILVVEDDPTLREGYRKVLEDEGCRVWTAPNGQEALEILRAGAEPCLILLDLNMPLVTGVEFLQRWKTEDSFDEFPVVVLTVEKVSTPVEPTERLTKPGGVKELPRLVDTYCGCDGDNREESEESSGAG